MRDLAWRVALGGGALVVLWILGVPLDALADNCSASNPSDCQAVPPNVTGTLGAAGVAATLGLLGGGGAGDTDAGNGERGDRTGSFLDDF
jgi:hypothetical protein